MVDTTHVSACCWDCGQELDATAKNFGACLCVRCVNGRTLDEVCEPTQVRVAVTRPILKLAKLMAQALLMAVGLFVLVGAFIILFGSA